MSVARPPAVSAVLRAPLRVVAVLAAVVVAVLAVPLAGGTAASGLDRWASSAPHGQSSQFWSAAWFVATLGDPLVAIILAGLLAGVLLVLGRSRLAVVAIIGLALTGVATTVLKPVVDRTIHGHYLAYPSGHTAAATVLALVVALLVVDLLRVRRLAGLLIIHAVAGVGGATMAWSQVVLNVHYLTDTIGGFATALAVVLPVALLVDRVAALQGMAGVAP